MTGLIEHRRRPCAKCPWRRDADLAVFSAEDIGKLRRTSGRPGAETPVGTGTMSCHLDQPGTRHEHRRCAGWLAAVGYFSLDTRMLVAFEKLPPEALEPGRGWPELYASFDELEQHWFRAQALAALAPSPRRAPGPDDAAPAPRTAV